MATRKGSNKSTPSTKKVLGKSTTKSPAKKNSQKTAKKKSVKKVDDELLNKGKRKAKRKKGFVPLKKGASMEVPSKVRKKSSYNIVSSAISKWCKENGARCTKKQISEIYQGLKERRLTGDPKYQLTAEDIELGIKGNLVLNKGTEKEEKVDLLAFKDTEGVPTQFFDFEWYFAPSFFNNDGLYFKSDDILRFDLTSIGRGVIEIYYSEFNAVYRDEIYEWITEEVEGFESESGKGYYGRFKLNEQATDIENRIFEWTFEGQDEGQVPTQEGREKVTGVKDKSLPTEAEAKAQKEEDKAREKQESAPPRKLSKKELEIKKIEAETENVKAKTELQRAETEAQNADMKKIEMGLMTKAEFKKKWKGK
jgi:hypothetical protein